MTQMMRKTPMAEPTTHTPDDSRAFRNALGQFATGVTVIATITEDGPIGMTANSFSSVSLTPPLVLWSIAKDSNRYHVFGDAQRFSINVLNADQGDLAMAFAKDGASFTEDNAHFHNGVPLINGALAQFTCDLETTFEGGDHTIILGRVTELTLGSGAPLVFHRGTFGSFEQS